MCVLNRYNILHTVYEFIFPYHIVVFQKLHTVKLTHIWILKSTITHTTRNNSNIPENSRPIAHLILWYPLICFIVPGVLHFPECRVSGLRHLCSFFQLAWCIWDSFTFVYISCLCLFIVEWYTIVMMYHTDLLKGIWVVS